MEYRICPAAEVCGGCDLQGLSYSKQIELKQKKNDELFKKICTPERMIAADQPFNYRNKVQVSFGKDEKGKIVTGNYARDSHFLVPVDDCMICDEKILEIIRSVKTLVNRHHLSVYDERIQKGCLRHLLVRSTKLGEYMLVIVTGSPHIRNEEALVKDIVRYNPELTTIIHNVNMAHTSMILGPKIRTLYGKGFITDELLGCRFRISPSSFYQVNRFQTEKLYQTAVAYADIGKDDTAIDAYCGTGTIGLIMARKAREVLGIEVNREAVRDAVKNKKENGIQNISFIEADAGSYMRQLAKEKVKIDVLVMDPPRSGADETFLRSVCILKPKRIVYVSCGPDTLYRDLKYLGRYGYVTKKIQPVDMFPFSEHIENVARLDLAGE